MDINEYRGKPAIIEGVHIHRGGIATMSYALATGVYPTHILCFGKPHRLAVGRRIHEIGGTWSDYYSALDKFLEFSDASLVIPTTIRGYIIANGYRDKHIVVSNPDLVNLRGFDKLRLLRQMPTFVLDHVRSSRPRERSTLTFPAIAKPRLGSGGDGHMVVGDIESIGRLKKSWAYTFEPKFSASATEFSVTFVFAESEVRWHGFRRIKMRKGRTTEAEHIVNSWPQELIKLIERLVESNTLSGIYNLQFAEIEDQCILFDINPRFSGSELLRSAWGFNFLTATPHSTTKVADVRLTDVRAIQLAQQAISQLH